MVYQHIKASANQGIWMKDLFKNTNLHRAVVNKTVKTLEMKQIIKPVKSVKNPSKKIYMLSELEPSVDITGGSWFTDNELDVEFVNALSRACLQYINERTLADKRHQQILVPNGGSSTSTSSAYPTAEQVLKFLTDKSITPIKLALEEVEDLLEMLVYDRQLEKLIGFEASSGRAVSAYRMHPRSAFLFNLITSNTSNTSNTSLITADGAQNWANCPCFKCPVRQDCHPSGRINPKDCQYLSEWLS